MSEEQVNPPMEDAIPVIMEDTQKAVEVEVTKEIDMDDSEEESDVSKAMENCSECGKECSPSTMKGGACSDCYTMKADMPAAVSEEDVNATTKMIDTINDHLTSALSTLAETVKALDAKIEGINKAITGVSNEVSEVKDSFGKRVDAVEKDTAFRKSADLGEILQEQPVVVKKSLWGGSFLKNADLFK
jgi:prophage DNA circulation protein